MLSACMHALPAHHHGPECKKLHYVVPLNAIHTSNSSASAGRTKIIMHTPSTLPHNRNHLDKVKWPWGQARLPDGKHLTERESAVLHESSRLAEIQL